jgi:5-methylcytosine-specific restriction protein A
MATYLLTWNPKKWDWKNLKQNVARVKRTGSLREGDWSVGNTKSINVGDRVFNMRLGVEPRGIFGSGRATSTYFTAPHWSGERGKKARYITMDWDTLLDPEVDRILPIDFLKSALDGMHWESQRSGISIPDDIAEQLEKHWGRLVGKRRRSLVPTLPQVIEGIRTETVRYDRGRSRALRDHALQEAHGICAACDTDFNLLLGGDGVRVLQVHHKKQLAASDAPRVTRLTDLTVVCANCHMLIHANPRHAVKVEALRKRLRADRRRR